MYLIILLQDASVLLQAAEHCAEQYVGRRFNQEQYNEFRERRRIIEYTNKSAFILKVRVQ